MVEGNQTGTWSPLLTTKTFLIQVCYGFLTGIPLLLLKIFTFASWLEYSSATCVHPLHLGLIVPSRKRCIINQRFFEISHCCIYRQSSVAPSLNIFPLSSTGIILNPDVSLFPLTIIMETEHLKRSNYTNYELNLECSDHISTNALSHLGPGNSQSQILVSCLILFVVALHIYFGVPLLFISQTVQLMELNILPVDLCGW